MIRGLHDTVIASPITDEEALKELERLVHHPDFRVSDRNRNFLRYIVIETLAGRGDAIKAYSVAVDVFGRPSSFDPMHDPVVRIEANRLRTALDKCYEAQPSAIRIEIPKGRYVAQFVRANTTDAPQLPEASQPDDPPPALTHEQKRSPRFPWVGWKAGALAAAVILFILYAYDEGAQFNSALSLPATPSVHQPTASDAPVRKGSESPSPLPTQFSEKPILKLDIETGHGWKAEDSVRFHDELLASLSRFPTLRVIEASVGKQTSDAAAATGDIGSIARTYPLLLKLERTDGRYVARWRLLNEKNELKETGEQTVDIGDEANAADFNDLIPRLSRDLAGYRGAVPMIEARLELDRPTLGNGCVQRALVTIGERLETIESSRACLEQTLAAQPGNADARAVLSLLILTAKPFETTLEERTRALELARTAVSLAPRSERSATALMIALYHNREVEAAIAAGHSAIALNPDEYLSRVYLGWILFSSGRWNEGVALVEEARGKSPLASNFDAGATIMLDAYRRGEYATVIDLLEKRPFQRPYLALLTLVATLGQLGRDQEAAAVIEALREAKPGFEQSFDEDMAARSLSPKIVALLKTGLLKAGLQLR